MPEPDPTLLKRDKTPKDVDVRWRAANTPAAKVKAVVKAAATGKRK